MSNPLIKSIGVKSIKTARKSNKRLRKRCSRSTWNEFSDFCDHTSIHGIQYLGEQRRHWIERLFWLFAFIVSLYLCSLVIWNLWKKWDETPVIVSFSEKSTRIWEIPFPAITICPQTKIKKEFLNYTNVYHRIRDHGVKNENTKKFVLPDNLTSDEVDYLHAVSHLCGSNTVKNMDFNETENIDIIGILDKIAPRLEDSFLSCVWDLQSSCTVMMKTVTESGICYTFNGLDPHDLLRGDGHLHRISKKNYRHSQWSLEKGFGDSSEFNTYPFRVISITDSELRILLIGNATDGDFVCRGPMQGFYVAIHPPDEVPQYGRFSFRVPFDKEIIVSVNPTMMTTTETLRQYSPEWRQCFFNEERYLRFFKVYTQNNCEIECEANYTLQQCGCVRFSSPVTDDVPLCGATKIDCYRQARRDLVKLEFKNRIKNGSRNYTKIRGCNCLPACTSLSFLTDVAQADLNAKGLMAAFRHEEIDLRFSRLRIRFTESEFHTSRRSELYGKNEFVANCGGLLGLFMGISVLSFIEIFYFCTFRVLVNKILRRRSMQTQTFEDIELELH